MREVLKQVISTLHVLFKDTYQNPNTLLWYTLSSVTGQSLSPTKVHCRSVLTPTELWTFQLTIAVTKQNSPLLMRNQFKHCFEHLTVTLEANALKQCQLHKSHYWPACLCSPHSSDTGLHFQRHHIHQTRKQMLAFPWAHFIHQGLCIWHCLRAAVMFLELLRVP